MAKKSSLTIKDHFRETHLFQKRILLTAIIAVLMLCLLIVRLIYLQIVNHDHYTTLSEENRLNILPLAPTRGLIYDRNGILLAQNFPTFTLNLIPEHVKDLDATLQEPH